MWSSDDEDDEIEYDEMDDDARPRSQTKRPRPVESSESSEDEAEARQRARPLHSDSDSFDAVADAARPTQAERDAFLAAVLQRRGFHYALMPHQFEGARFVAGLPADWPQQIVRQSLTATLRTTKYVMEPNQQSPTLSAIFADEMGLGKTVQSIAGAELRKAIREAKDQPQLLTMVVCPNDGVLNQWHEHIRYGHRYDHVGPRVVICAGGAKRERIVRQAPEGAYVLVSRYQLLRHMMDVSQFESRKKSALFPKASIQLLHEARMLHDANQDPQKFYKELASRYYHEDLRSMQAQLKKKGAHDKGEILRRIINEDFPKETRETDAIYDLVIVDECHLLKNDCAWWSIDVTLLGHSSQRFLAVTGTPFCNRLRDIANLIKYGDGKNVAAKEKFFKKAVSHVNEADGRAVANKANSEIAEYLKRWRRVVDADGNDRGPRSYLARKKKDVLADKLPTKTELVTKMEIVKRLDVPQGTHADKIAELNEAAQSGELKQYMVFEEALLEKLGEFVQALTMLRSNPSNPLLNALADKAMKKFVAMAQLARGSLVHPMLPCDGRSVTMCYVKKRSHKPCTNIKCHHCNKGEPLSDLTDAIIKNRIAAHTEQQQSSNTKTRGRTHQRRGRLDADAVARDFTGRVDDNEDDQYNDRDELDDREDGGRGNRSVEDQKFTELPKPYCACRHGVHPDCYMHLDEMGAFATGNLGCALCLDVQRRCLLGAHATSSPTPKLYCEDGPLGGFVASSKLTKVLDLIREYAIRKQEKMVIFSFFKGPLDLIEAIFESETEFGAIECARYDGDVHKTERANVLKKFSTRPELRVLLATVHSAGVGLNITAANNFVFMDRWWNPCVHDQAMDRCHRIGQTKDVNVHFLDAEDTVDDVMREINEIKRDNGAVILMDGTEIAAAGAGGPRWRELAGVMSSLFLQIRARREEKMGIHNNVELTWSSVGPRFTGQTPNPSDLSEVLRDKKAGGDAAESSDAPLSDKLKKRKNQYVLDPDFQREQQVGASTLDIVQRVVALDADFAREEEEVTPKTSDGATLKKKKKGNQYVLDASVQRNEEASVKEEAREHVSAVKVERAATSPAFSITIDDDDDDDPPMTLRQQTPVARAIDLTQDRPAEPTVQDQKPVVDASQSQELDLTQDRPAESPRTRVQDQKPVETSQSQEIDLTHDSDDAESQAGEEWSCVACTYRHVGGEASSQSCVICLTRRAAPDETPSSPPAASKTDVGTAPLSLDWRNFENYDFL